MLRAKLWFTCAAMHDPVTPIIARPALIGWDAKHRTVDLQIERTFSGDELVRRMKGWVTVDPREAIDVVKDYGRLKILDDRDLVVEMETEKDYEGLNAALKDRFSEEVTLELLKKSG